LNRRSFVLGAFDTALRADEYRMLRDLVCERLGLWFGPDARTSLERRLRERLVAHGLDTFGEYCQLLKYGARANEEWDEVAEALTIHETYFYREDYQLRAFKNEVLPMLADRCSRRRQLQIWSAGCSTGEEAYTIAILILESGYFDGWNVRVYGSDVSKKCVQAARRGVYGTSSLRATSELAKCTWFRSVTEEGQSRTTVIPEVRALCQFGQLNLLDEERTHLVGRCDAVFCRNVLIYFDASTRKRVIDRFHERLLPGGVLFLGHSESLLNVSTAFELLHLSEDLVYQKPLSVGRES
jgi:chemotaxis protein methyltransferase CheR